MRDQVLPAMQEVRRAADALERVTRILAETDLPKGTFSILPCSNDDASQLVEDERIALLSFTGGLVGWELKARAGKKKVTK